MNKLLSRWAELEPNVIQKYRHTGGDFYHFPDCNESVYPDHSDPKNLAIIQINVQDSIAIKHWEWQLSASHTDEGYVGEPTLWYYAEVNSAEAHGLEYAEVLLGAYLSALEIERGVTR